MDNYQSDSSHSLDTLGAQGFLNQSTILHNLDFLEIGFECAFGGFHRMAAVLTKGCSLAASLTFSHCCGFLSKYLAILCGGNITTSPAVHQLQFMNGDLEK
jgi:hypothetical protein